MLKLFYLIKYFVGCPIFKIKFQTCGGKTFYEVKLEGSSQPSGRTNMKFFVSKYLRIQYNSNPHYRYVVRYTLSSLVNSVQHL